MFTVISPVYASESLSRDEFVATWVKHAPIAAKLPGLRSYRICPVTSAANILGEEIDGFAIFEYDSEEAYEAALASPEYQAALEDSPDFARHFSEYRADLHRIV